VKEIQTKKSLFSGNLKKSTRGRVFFPHQKLKAHDGKKPSKKKIALCSS